MLQNKILDFIMLYYGKIDYFYLCYIILRVFWFRGSARDQGYADTLARLEWYRFRYPSDEHAPTMSLQFYVIHCGCVGQTWKIHVAQHS